MNAVIHVNNLKHQVEYASAMRAGLEKHGLKVSLGLRNTPEKCDFAVVWGVKHQNILRSNKNVLVMERGHVGNRMKLTSCGWNGLGRRGIYPLAKDGGGRWRENHGHLMQPWKANGDYALVIGQVEADAALHNLSEGFGQWSHVVCKELIGMGHRVFFRPHPMSLQ